MITPTEAWDIVAENIQPLESVALDLMEAADGYLAQPLAADRDIPPSNRSAMDGFAVRHADLQNLPAPLTVIGEVAAGSPDTPAIAPGECVRIFTGANIPPDADTVVPVEQTSMQSFAEGSEALSVEFTEHTEKGRHIFRQGENARQGETLLPAGTRMGPRQIGIAAATGHERILIYRRPRVHILATGAELLEHNMSARSHQVRDSNGPLLMAALREAGCGEVSRARVPDDLPQTVAAVSQALEMADVIILTGGISAGLYDYVPQALEKAGAEILYRGVAMKPGKPQLFARTQTGAYVFGLPGNPLSSIVGMYELVLPAVRRLAGCPANTCRPLLHLPLAAAVDNRGDRQRIIPAVIEDAPSGSRIKPCPAVGSADLITAGRVDGAVLVPPGKKMNEGEVAAFRPWGGIGV